MGADINHNSLSHGSKGGLSQWAGETAGWFSHERKVVSSKAWIDVIEYGNDAWQGEEEQKNLFHKVLWC